MKIRALFLVILACPASFAQTSSRSNPASSLYQSGIDYRLGTGDTVEISVFGVNSFNHTVRVDASGLIRIPLLGEVSTGGLTTAELEQKLESLLDGRLVRNPDVTVLVKEYRPRLVFVLGAVVRPGQYQIAGSLNLIEVLSMAGGLTPAAADELSLQRRPKSSDTGQSTPAGNNPELLKVNLKDLLEGGQLSLNIAVQEGDVIHVPDRVNRVFYVIGEVTAAGSFQIPPKKNLLITEALALAGGPLKTAKKSKGILIRYDETGKRQELPVDYSAILKGKKPDFPVQPNDIIFVPGSTFKDVGYGLLGAIPGTVSSAVIQR